MQEFTLRLLCWFIAALGGPLLMAAEKEGAGRWALLVGVDDYSHVERLKFCGADMQALAARLVESGFPERHVYLLHDKATQTKYRPMKANIEEQLDLVLSLVERDDLLVLAFSGHGVHLEGKSYLCPSEARLNDAQTMIPLERVYERLEKCPAALKVMLVDACRNDPRLQGQRSLSPGSDTRKFAAALETPPQGILLLTSCAPGQISMEEKEFGHGVFMNYVLEGLAGQADGNRDGSVSLLELFKYASDHTKTYVARRFSGYQTPSLKGDIHDDFDLARGTPAGGNSLGLKFVSLPAGKFLMGSPPGRGIAHEQPAHEVALCAFQITATEITQQQYAAVMEENPSWFAPGAPGAKHLAGVAAGKLPVERVSYEQAVEFCRRLGERERLPAGTYRLPSEAQWEYAARAGATGDFAPAAQRGELQAYAWMYDNAAGRTHEVGTRKANAWGLFDTSGNVAEWCSDWYAADYYARSPAEDPPGPAQGGAKAWRVLRGGSWNDEAEVCRAADREAAPPAARENCYGFRIVRMSPSAPGR